MQPYHLTLELTPRRRFDLIDVTTRLRSELGGRLDRYPRTLYCSHHTTAGFLDQRQAARLEHRRDRLDPYIRDFQRLFPFHAGYRHDEMAQRTELTEAERRHEPPNGDAHLTFIGSGLQGCVTYRNDSATRVFFTDLDGVFQGRSRRRKATVVAFTRVSPVAEFDFEVPVSRHAIDSVNLYDDPLGLRRQIDELLAHHRVRVGRLDISVDGSESATAVTVNEYETLLMRHDLAEVLRDPLRFVAQQGRRALGDLGAVPTKTLGYARFDLVRVVNETMDALGLSESIVERVMARLMSYPASRRLRLKQTLSLAVHADTDGLPQVVCGRYQTPILIQWRAAPRRSRRLRITLNELE